MNVADMPKRVLVVTPHPDDAEGGCGGTLAKWIEHGAEVFYVLCTNGDKGTEDPTMSQKRLASVREKEQQDAADVLGVKGVVFLGYPDGGLEDDRRFREQVVRQIRRHKPEVVMCCDPLRSRRHSHRDHRISGQVTVDAVCTYAWRHLYFPDQISVEGLLPHAAREIYLWGSEEPDTFVDISENLEMKAQSLLKHVSQFPDPEGREERVRTNASHIGQEGGLPYAEDFRVIRFLPHSLLLG